MAPNSTDHESGFTFDELMQSAKEWNDAQAARAPEGRAESGESESESSTAAAASPSSGDVVPGAISSAYTGTTSVIVKETFSKIKNTMRAMCWCPMCKQFTDPEKMVSGCELPDGQRMASDDKVPPCMICDGCARKDAHKSSRKDGSGNSYCKACPKTLLFLKSLYESRGEELPRHLAVRNNIAKHRCQPCGNSACLKLLQEQVAELQESYTAEQLQNDRTHRRLAARIEVHEKNASGRPAAPHKEREERRRIIRVESSGGGAGAVAEEAVAEEAVAEGGEQAAVDGDAEDMDLEAGLSKDMEYDAVAEAAVAAVDTDGNSEIGEDASRATGVATGVRCEGGEQDDDEEDDEPLSNRGQAAKKRRVGGSTAVRSAAASARKRPKTAVQVATNDDSGDDEGGEGGEGGATGPADEAERQAINYKCPKKLEKKYRQFLQTGKSTADWIAHLEVEKTEAEATRVSNKDKLKNYDAVVKERDQAKARAEAEAKSKKKCVQQARKEGAEKLKVYSNIIQQCMALLRHVGVADEDVERLANDNLLAEALFAKYPATEAGTSAGGAVDAAAAEAEGAGDA